MILHCDVCNGVTIDSFILLRRGAKAHIKHSVPKTKKIHPAVSHLNLITLGVVVISTPRSTSGNTRDGVPVSVNRDPTGRSRMLHDHRHDGQEHTISIAPIDIFPRNIALRPLARAISLRGYKTYGMDTPVQILCKVSLHIFLVEGSDLVVHAFH
jgi:hypothetical protein